MARTPHEPDLVAGPEARSPARQALADAIARRDAVNAEIRAAEAAHEAAIEWAAGGFRRIEAAEKRLAEIGQNAATYARQLAAGTAGDTPPTVEQLRQEVQAATEERETARAGRDAIQADLQALRDHRLPEVVRRVETAAQRVLQAEAGAAAHAAADDAERLQRALAESLNALTWFANAGAFPTISEPGTAYGRPADDRVRDIQARFGTNPHGWDLLAEPVAHRRLGVWQAWLRDLQADPDAVVPA